MVLKKVSCFMISIMMLVSSCRIGAFAQYSSDNSECCEIYASKTEEGEMDIIPYDYVPSIASLSFDAENTYDGHSTVKWSTSGSNSQVQIAVNSDVSGYESINLILYSPKATNDYIGVHLTDGRNRTYGLKVDWSGWKSISIPFENFGDFNSSNLKNVELWDYGWKYTYGANNESLNIARIWFEPIHGPEPLTKEDINEILVKWNDYITGGDIDGEFANKIKRKVESDALLLSNRMNKGNDRVILWGDKVCASTAEMGDQYNDIYYMALGYATPGTVTYKNSMLLDNIKDALAWGYENLYGDDEVHNIGWRDTSAFNWYEWQIVVPRNLTKTLLLIRDEISQEELQKYLKPAEYFMTEKFNPLLGTEYHGANIAETAISYILSRLLCGDGDAPAKYLPLITRDFDYTDEYSGDGQHRDGSYRFHYDYAMNGTYSISFMSAAVPIMSILAGTALKADDSALDAYADWLVRAYDTTIYNGREMSMFRGRHPGNEKNLGIEAIKYILEFAETVDGDRRTRLLESVKYYGTIGAVNTDSFSIYQYNLYQKLMNDDRISPRGTYENFNMFYNTDKATVHRHDYAVGISMSSSRVCGWESINKENMKGWYMGDGMMYIYNDNDQNSYETDYWSNVNYQRLPGTTVDTQIRQETSVKDSERYRSSQNFVGGVKFEEKYGLAAMVLESYHIEKDGGIRTDYGDSPPVHQNDLVANKSYFVFDDEVVCLGSGINSTMNYDVETIVENRKSVNGEINAMDKMYIDGKETPKDTAAHTYNNVKTAAVENGASYVFLQPTDVTAHKSVGGASFNELWIEHGKNPSDSGYAYVVLPNAGVTKLQDYSDNPDVEVVENSVGIQAVKERSTGIFGAVFYENGSVGGITAETPCTVMMRKHGSAYVITVSDPTQLEENIRLRINDIKNFRLNTDASDAGISVCGDIIDFNVKGLQGRELTAVFFESDELNIRLRGKNVNEQINIVYDYANGSAMDKEISIIEAIYDGELLVKCTKTQKVLKAGNCGEIKLSRNIIDYAGKKMKVFVWRDMPYCNIPLCKSVECSFIKN